VGALATIPLGRSLVGFAKTESFLLFTRGYAQTQEWQLWQRKAQENAPPLPGPPAPPAAPPQQPPAGP
jgi:hypothetical protein